jgi:hypothetical protein
MRKKKRTQKKIVEELRKQLLIQAERLGIRDRFTPVWFLEQRVLALSQILSEFYAERANLEYELNMIGSDKKDLIIKLEKLHSFIRTAETAREKYIKRFEKTIDKEFKLSEFGQKLAYLKKTEVKAVA